MCEKETNYPANSVKWKRSEESGGNRGKKRMADAVLVKKEKKGRDGGKKFGF